ncbi:MAG: glycosyltransferase family 9 protein [Cyanobacteria bacterium SIG30]|nr:glycosyltransferase family 9 protein [Cyanobacteria bacterium SIG30]
MDIKKKFLIIRLSALGDIVHCLPVANAIREKYKDAQIDWVVGDNSSALIKNNPLIDNVYIANLSKWKKNWLSPTTIKEICELNKRLQKENYDYSIDLHGMFKSLIINAFCGAKHRIGYKDYKEFATLACNFLMEPKSKRPHRNYHIVQRNLDLLRAFDILTKEELENVKPKAILPESSIETKKNIDDLLLNINKEKPIVIFAPATTWDTKHWLEANWQKLYQELKDETNIIFSGVKKDIELINRITKNDEKAIILAGKTNLSEYIELLKRAKVVISPDSSAAHFAWALGVQTITLFCATSKNTFAPIGNIAFPKGKEICIPCHKRKCKNPVCTFQTSALEVANEVRELIK